MIHWLFVGLAVFGTFTIVNVVGLLVLLYVTRDREPECWPDGRPVIVEWLEPRDFG
jgi:hypothetical protein